VFPRHGPILHVRASPTASGRSIFCFPAPRANRRSLIRARPARTPAARPTIHLGFPTPSVFAATTPRPGADAPTCLWRHDWAPLLRPLECGLQGRTPRPPPNENRPCAQVAARRRRVPNENGGAGRDPETLGTASYAAGSGGVGGQGQCDRASYLFCKAGRNSASDRNNYTSSLQNKSISQMMGCCPPLSPRNARPPQNKKVVRRKAAPFSPQLCLPLALCLLFGTVLAAFLVLLRTLGRSVPIPQRENPPSPPPPLEIHRSPPWHMPPSFFLFFNGPEPPPISTRETLWMCEWLLLPFPLRAHQEYTPRRASVEAGRLRVFFSEASTTLSLLERWHVLVPGTPPASPVVVVGIGVACGSAWPLAHVRAESSFPLCPAWRRAVPHRSLRLSRAVSPTAGCGAFSPRRARQLPWNASPAHCTIRLMLPVAEAT